jgi:hypothetical protein
MWQCGKLLQVYKTTQACGTRERFVHSVQLSVQTGVHVVAHAFAYVAVLLRYTCGADIVLECSNATRVSAATVCTSVPAAFACSGK